MSQLCNTVCNVPDVLEKLYVHRETHMAAPFTLLSCQLDVFHLRMTKARGRPSQMPHSQLELTSRPFSFFLLFLISLHFISLCPYIAVSLACNIITPSVLGLYQTPESVASSLSS